MYSNEIVRFLLIIIAACVFIYLIHTYNNNPVSNAPSDLEPFYADGEQTQNSPTNNNNNSDNESENNSDNESENNSDNESVNNSDNETVNNNQVVNNSDTDPLPSEGEGDENATFKTVENNNENNENNSGNNVNSNRLPNECYPKDVLTPKDLLPQDSNSTWAQTVPNGQGSLGDQNFLNAGFHVGINTVGQSLRNANLQLRSEPANPQMKVSPWLQTTIEPDVNRRALEIGA